MAEGDIPVTFVADDESLTAAVKRFQAELYQLDAQAVATGRKFSEAFSKLGISPERAFKLANPQDRADLVQFTVAEEQAAKAANELGESTGRAGINIESMMTRMAARMAILEVVRLAIGGVVNAFKEMAAIETARVNFENLTTAMENAEAVERRLTQTTLDTNIAFEKLSPAVISLEDAGEGPRAAAEEVDSLAKRAAATGGDVDKLAKALEAVKLDEATVPEMFELAHAGGTAKDELVGLVTQYAELERSIKRADHARAEALIVMDEQVRAEERVIDANQRAADIQQRATERAITDQERLTGVQESFLEKALGKAPGQADPLLAQARQLGGLPGSAGGKQMTADIAAGFQQIYKEEGLTEQGMQHYVDTGVIGLREILAAAKRLHEAEKEARTETAEKSKQEAEDRKRALAENLQDAKKEETETKRAEKAQLDTARLNIENQITAAMKDQSNITDELNKKMTTFAEQLKTVWTSLGTIARSGQGQGFLGVLGEFIGLNDIRRAAPGLQAAAAQLSVKEANSDKIEGHLNTIAGALTGHGTP